MYLNYIMQITIASRNFKFLNYNMQIYYKIYSDIEFFFSYGYFQEYSSLFHRWILSFRINSYHFIWDLFSHSQILSYVSTLL